MTRAAATTPVGLVKRRELLRGGTLGIGSLALSQLLTRTVRASGRHHEPRAKNVIFLHMVGGPSQMDTFDPKPELDKWDGKSLPEEVTRGQKLAFVKPDARVIKSPYAFAPRGESGIVMSELFPHLATVADELTMIRSMRTNEINHGSAEMFLHTGHGRLGRPTFGAWTSYGLGTENDDLPAYVVLKDQHPNAGPAAWSSGFLPPRHQGVQFRTGAKPLFYLDNPDGVTSDERKDVIDTIGRLNSLAFERYNDPEIETRIGQYELAWQMQTSVPELADFGSEPDHVRKLYGLDTKGRGWSLREELPPRTSAGGAWGPIRPGLQQGLGSPPEHLQRDPPCGATSGPGVCRTRPGSRAARTAGRNARDLGRRVWPNPHGAGEQRGIRRENATGT